MVVLNIGLLAAVAAAQTRPVAIVGGMLIDGISRAPLTDSTIIVPMKDIFATQDIETVLMDGKRVDRSFTPGYKNPLPRPIADRPE